MRCALGVVYLVWGSTYLAIAIVVQTLPPLLSAASRFLTAGVILAAALAVQSGLGRLRVTRREIAAAGVVGLALLLLGNGFVQLGERTVPSGLTALIIGSVPLWVVVWRLLSGEGVGRAPVVGVALGFTGVAVLVVPRGISGSVDPLGMLFIIGASASWASGSFLSPRLQLPRDPLVSTSLQMVCGGLGLLTAGVLAGEPFHTDLTRASTSSLLALCYLIVFGSLLAFTAYTWLLQHAPISLVATYAYVNPVVAVLLGGLLLHEDISISILIGAAMIIGAVAFIVWREATHPVGTEPGPGAGEPPGVERPEPPGAAPAAGAARQRAE